MLTSASSMPRRHPVDPKVGRDEQQEGSVAQSGSAQSISPSPSLSMPSVQFDSEGTVVVVGRLVVVTEVEVEVVELLLVVDVEVLDVEVLVVIVVDVVVELVVGAVLLLVVVVVVVVVVEVVLVEVDVVGVVVVVLDGIVELLVEVVVLVMVLVVVPAATSTEQPPEVAAIAVPLVSARVTICSPIAAGLPPMALNVTRATLTIPVGVSRLVVLKAANRDIPLRNEAGFEIGAAENSVVVPPCTEAMVTSVATYVRLIV